MKHRAEIDVCCNDPDNGAFSGRAVAIHYRLGPGDYVEIESDRLLDNGYAFTETEKGFRLHRREFAVVGGKEWIGNWCWNAYYLERGEMKRLLMMLRASGRWHCVHGPTRWFDWFNKPSDEKEGAAPDAGTLFADSSHGQSSQKGLVK